MAFTPLGMACWAVVALAGIVHQWQDGAWPWWLLGAAGVLAGLAWEAREVAVCRFAAALDGGQLRLGRTEDLVLAFANAEPRPLQAAYAAAPPTQIRAGRETRYVSVPAEGSSQARLRVRAVRLGAAEWPRLPLRIKGPLGLAWWSKPQRLDAVFEVVPDLHGAAPTRIGLRSAGRGLAAIGAHGSELDHLRDYQPGDPRHSVDWKATARRGALTTRVRQEEQAATLMLVVDAGRTSRAAFDGMSQLGHYANACARLAARAAASGDRVGLVAASDAPALLLPPARGMAAVGRLRQALAGIETTPVETDLLAAAAVVRRSVRQRALVVLLTDLAAHANSSALLRCVGLWLPTHLPVVAGLVAQEVQAVADKPAEDWLDPYLSLAAHLYQQQLGNACGALRRLGALPLAASPATLEADLLRSYRMLKRQRRV